VTHYTPSNNPLNDRRAWADLCRSRAFPAVKVGRRWIARCEDFDAWFASQSRNTADTVEGAARIAGVELCR
jgi:hypothetical protein